MKRDDLRQLSDVGPYVCLCLRTSLCDRLSVCGRVVCVARVLAKLVLVFAE